MIELLVSSALFCFFWIGLIVYGLLDAIGRVLKDIEERKEMRKKFKNKK